MNFRTLRARFFGGLTVLVATAQPLVAVGDPAQPVTRYVLAYSDPATAWEIDRGTAHLVPVHGLALSVGDCVVLHDPSGASAPEMTLIVDGREVDVNRNHPRFCVPDSQPQNPTALAIMRTFTALAGVFHSAEQDYDAQNSTTMTTRGIGTPRPAIPLLEGDDQGLAAGTRSLALAWTSGVAPFTISVARAGATNPLATTTAPQKQVRFAPMTFSPGTYRVTVDDARHARRTQRFTVVPLSALPPPSTDVASILADPSLPPDLRATYDAARLMADPTDKWWLEAYQRVIGSVDRSALAQRLAYELALGPP
jgi:hypothetical protein